LPPFAQRHTNPTQASISYGRKSRRFHSKAVLLGSYVAEG
jgi:hypothetical protein